MPYPSRSSTTSDSSRSSHSPKSAPSSRSSQSPRLVASLPDRSKSSSANKPTTFLFIDAQEDHAQNTTLRKQKQAFLLKNYNRKKKQAAIQRLKTPVGAPINRLRIGNASLNDESAEDDPTPATADTLRSEMWSLKAYLSQGYVDPFSSSAVTMSDSMNLYFHHFRIHTIAACYPLDATRMSIWWWQKAITQPALLQALLFLTAGHQATLESRSGISMRTIQRSMRDSLQLRGSTLKNLNDIMQDPLKAVAESTTLVVASLVAIEAVDANFEALEAHMKGLKRLIHLMGGLDNLDHMTLSKIYQSDVKSAALNNARPTFPISARWRSEILQDSAIFQTTNGNLDIPQHLSSLGASFSASSAWYSSLDQTMQTFLSVFRRLILYYEIAQLRPSVVMETDNDLFLVFEHELLSLRHRYYPSAEDIHEPLRLSLLIYVNLRIWHFQRFPFMQYMVEALKQSLEISLAHLTTSAADLLFWMMFIGGLASQGYATHRWFVNHLRRVTSELGLEEWGDARKVLEGFFYTEQATERKAEEDLWNEVLTKGAYTYIAPKPSVSTGAIATNSKKI
ncbi:hypothetical protein BJY04DRAFT_26343 [Aspergillus karnatakaensis]|uniref:uncharacterized protein n=1 Tax=Aspergillus karnatakaensis TaxID=1810916 RepID=UPI003CCD460E